jgi:hypothetical protein
MNMPSFSADASLYRGGAHYQGGAMLAGVRQEGEVIPSRGAWMECNCWGEGQDTVCSCYWRVGDSGGSSTCDRKSCRTITW